MKLISTILGLLFIVSAFAQQADTISAEEHMKKSGNSAMWMVGALVGFILITFLRRKLLPSKNQ